MRPRRGGGGTVQLRCDGRRWRTRGEVKGKLANGEVASTLHTTSDHGVSSVTTADAHISTASSRLNRRPRRFKWTRPFRRKTKSGFCARAITFQTQSTALQFFQSRRDVPAVYALEREVIQFYWRLARPRAKLKSLWNFRPRRDSIPIPFSL